MQSSISAWISENARTYFANATSTRDFRVQMRGSKAVTFFTLFLGLLILIAYVVYSSAVSGYDTSIVNAQNTLRQFYWTIMTTLGFIVSVVTPTMSATAIVTERQRQSLDLVFSAPVSPKYYLVGKLISSFRYTWMLLVLALPVTAACVVLGGATWKDVLLAYIFLSFQGIVLGAFALAASIPATKATQAVLSGLLISFGYNIVTAAISEATMVPRFTSHGDASEMSVFGTLSPFFVETFANTHMTILGIQFPNWILCPVVCILMSKFFLAISGVQLVPYSKWLATIVRLHGLLYAVAVALIVTLLAGPGVLSPSHWSSTGFSPSSIAGASTAWFCGILALFTPACAYTSEGELRLKPNGLFNFKNAFDGTPAGNLPFFLIVVASIYVVDAIGLFMTTGQIFGFQYWAYAFYSAGLWTLAWGVVRGCSALIPQLKQAQGISIAVMIAIVGLPLPLFNSVMDHRPVQFETTVWDLYLLRPLGGFDYPLGSARVLVYAVILAAIGLLIAWRSEAWRVKFGRPSPMRMPPRVA